MTFFHEVSIFIADCVLNSVVLKYTYSVYINKQIIGCSGICVCNYQFTVRILNHFFYKLIWSYHGLNNKMPSLVVSSKATTIPMYKSPRPVPFLVKCTVNMNDLHDQWIILLNKN